jgi:hypothetical protein
MKLFVSQYMRLAGSDSKRECCVTSPVESPPYPRSRLLSFVQALRVVTRHSPCIECRVSTWPSGLLGVPNVCDTTVTGR